MFTHNDVDIKSSNPIIKTLERNNRLFFTCGLKLQWQSEVCFCRIITLVICVFLLFAPFIHFLCKKELSLLFFKSARDPLDICIYSFSSISRRQLHNLLLLAYRLFFIPFQIVFFSQYCLHGLKRVVSNIMSVLRHSTLLVLKKLYSSKAAFGTGTKILQSG